MPQHIKAKYKSLRYTIPYLEMLLNEMTHTSLVKEIVEDFQKVYMIGHYVFKVYSLKGMLADQSIQIRFYNEYALSKQARELGFSNVLHLGRLCFSEDHIAINYHRFPMTLDKFLKEYRNP